MGDVFGIGGGAQAIGNVAAAGINAASQDATNATNIGIAEKNTAFQERMSSTAYQRATEDMKKAGINPMMAAMKGGASTPSGSVAHAEAPNWGDIAGQAGNSAHTLMNFKRDLAQKDANVAKTQAEALTEVARAENIKTNTTATGVGTDVTRAELPAKKAEAEVKKAKAGWDKRFSGWDAVTGRIFDAIGNSGKAIHDFKTGLRGAHKVEHETKGYNGRGSAYKQGVQAGRRGR